MAHSPTRLLRLVGLLILAATLLPGQSRRSSRPQDPWVPIPEDGPCCSAVDLSQTPEGVLTGTFELTSDREPVVDGDTIRVRGLRSSLRLLHIDTEETFKDDGNRVLARKSWKEYLKNMYADADPAKPPKFGTPMGEAAKRFCAWFFRGVRFVRLEYDRATRRRGYYGRHLVYVIAHKSGRAVNYNVEVVRQGLSPYFVKYGRSHRFHEAFVAAEREARAAKRGIWADPVPFACYPDYEARLRWWTERDGDLQTVAAMLRHDPQLIELGVDEAWPRLKAKVGEKVTVVGVPDRFDQKKKIALHWIGHQRGRDFAIAGETKAVKDLGLDARRGDLLLITGIVSLHRGNPQFRAETVSVKTIPRDH